MIKTEAGRARWIKFLRVMKVVLVVLNTVVWVFVAMLHRGSFELPRYEEEA